jgi:hypothetical protein
MLDNATEVSASTESARPEAADSIFESDLMFGQMVASAARKRTWVPIPAEQLPLF